MHIYSIVTPQRESSKEIRSILEYIGQTYEIIFMEDWVETLLTLFSNKQEIIKFSAIFAHVLSLKSFSTLCKQEQDQQGCIESIDLQDMQDLLKADQGHSYVQPQSISEPNEGWFSLIQNMLSENPYLNQQQISQQLNTINHNAPSALQVQNILISYGYTIQNINKLSIHRNSVQNIQNRYKYCLQYYHLSKENNAIFFFDRRKFNMNFCCELIWTQFHMPNHRKCVEEIQLSAIIQKGHFYYQISQKDCQYGSQHSTISLLNTVNQNNKGRNCILIISDKIVVGKELKGILLSNEWRLFMLPPFSTQLNPLHAVFTHINQELRTHRDSILSLDKLREHLNDICCKINPSFFLQSLDQHVIDGLTRSLIE